MTRPQAGYQRPGEPPPEECTVINPMAYIGGDRRAAEPVPMAPIAIAAADMPTPERVDLVDLVDLDD